MPVLSESTVQQGDKWYRTSKVQYQSSTGASFLVDQGAVSATVVFPTSGGPSVSLGDADGNGEKTVTLSGSSLEGMIDVLTVYNTTPSSFKPSTRV